MLEHRPRREQQPRPPRPAHQLDRHDAVAAQLEEVVVDPDPLDAPAPRQTARTASPPAPSAARAAPPPAAAPAPAARAGRACRSASAADDPAPRSQTAPCGPASCRRQRGTQRRDVERRARRRHHIAHQPLAAPARILAAPPPPPATPRLPQQHRLDLARLDPEPAQLHLRVRPPQKLQHAVAATAPGPRSGTSGSPAAPCGSATNRSAVSPARPR